MRKMAREKARRIRAMCNDPYLLQAPKESTIECDFSRQRRREQGIENITVSLRDAHSQENGYHKLIRWNIWSKYRVLGKVFHVFECFCRTRTPLTSKFIHLTAKFIKQDMIETRYAFEPDTKLGRLPFPFSNASSPSFVTWAKGKHRKHKPKKSVKLDHSGDFANNRRDRHKRNKSPLLSNTLTSIYALPSSLDQESVMLKLSK